MQNDVELIIDECGSLVNDHCWVLIGDAALFGQGPPEIRDKLFINQVISLRMQTIVNFLFESWCCNPVL